MAFLQRGRRGTKSPRARRARINSGNGGQHHHGHNAPTTLSPRAPPQALGRPPKAFTPCWHSQEFPTHLQPRGSPLEALKQRRRESKRFIPLTDGAFAKIPCQDRHVHYDEHLSHNNAQDFRRFLIDSRMPIKQLLPRLQNLSREQVVQRISKAKTFPHIMEGFHAKEIQTRLQAGDGARALIDPSSKAWGDKSPRFSRLPGEKMLLSTLAYRASMSSTFGAERDNFYVS